MIHPFMPFLSEELWQRLPRRDGDTTPSIVKARYPEYAAEYDDAQSAREYGLLISCSQGLRSLISDYGIKKDGIGMVLLTEDTFECVHLTQLLLGYLSSVDSAEYSLLRAEKPQIEALVGRSLASVILLAHETQPPPGCAVYPISSSTTVYLDVGSHTDIALLIEKTTAKLAKLSDFVARQRKFMTAEGWSDKVSAATKDAEVEKLSAAEAQMMSLKSSIEQFKRLNLG